MFILSRESKPYVWPFGAFMLLLALGEVINWIFKGFGPFWLAEPLYWIYPLQTILCGALLWKFRRSTPWDRWRQPAFTILVAILVLTIWISPQELFERPRRLVGFDPNVFADSPALYWTNLLFRFARLTIVVPMLEEIFWRGFLLRYLIDEDFLRIPFGTFSPPSFLIVAGLFGLAHAGPDFIPAVITGLLYNWVACRTKSLTACVMAHAVTNFVLGLYIMQTGQWGFW